jgi:hypothetical protein
MLDTQFRPKIPLTTAVRDALRGVDNSLVESDLLFLESWEMTPTPNLGAALRANQIRRANPGLSAAIEAELKAIARRR